MGNEKVWVADGGAFKVVKDLWIADGGTFKKSKSMFTADGGTFKETSIFHPLRILHTLSGWAGYYPHAEVVVSWNTEITGFDPSDPVNDRILIRWTDRSRNESGRVEDTNPAGQAVLVLPRVDTEYEISVTARVLGVEIPLETPTMSSASFNHRTSRTPAITNPYKWETPTAFGASWDVNGYINNHMVRWLNAETFAELGSNWIGAGNGPGSRFEASWPYAQNTSYAYEIMAASGDVLSDPVRFSGRTGSLYTPGIYYVNTQQKRTWVVGNKKVARGFNHKSDDYLWHGHGGTWNDYGTQIAVFYYWNDGSWVNPFQTILDALNNGATCTKLEVRVFRAWDGYSRGLPVFVQTHGHKWVPDHDRLNLHDNLHKAYDQAWEENELWIRFDPSLARWLADSAGNGLAIGNSENNKDSYFDMFRHSSGALRFTLA